MNDKTTGGFHYAYLIVISMCAILIAPVSFTFSTAGIFYAPVSKDLGVGTGTFGIYMTVLTLCMALFMPFAGKIIAKKNIRVVLSTCVILVAGSFALMSTFTSVYLFYVTGAILGISMSFLFTLAAPTLISNWFKQRVGFFIGLCMAFTGIGGVIFNPIGGYIIANYGWRMGYLTWAVVSAIIALPFTLFVVRKYPSEKGLRPYGDTDNTNIEKKQEIGVSASVAMKSSSFYLVVVFAAIVSLLSTINFYIPAYAGSIGLTATIGATAASAVMLGQMFGKIILGMVNDKSVTAGIIIGIGGGFLGLGSLVLFGSMGAWAVMFGCFLYGICYATVAVQNPMLTKTIFGQREYSQIFANVSMVGTLASAVGASLWGFIVEGTGSYATTLLIAVGFTLVAFVVGILALKAGKNLVQTSDSGKKIGA